MKKFDADTKVVQLIFPVDASDGAVTGDWVSMEHYDSLLVVYSAGDGTGTMDVDVKLRQATASDGSDAKDVDAGQWSVMQAATAAAVSDTFALDGTAGSGEFENDGENLCVGRIEITADQLDVAGGYSWVTVATTDPGSGEKLISAVGILRGARYAVAVDQQPTVLS